jgi:hypothetical protein
MADVIARVRLLIGDPSGEQFADTDIQDVLDMSRVVVSNAVLQPSVTLTANGILNYTDFYAEYGNWESDAVLQNGAFEIQSDMAESDYLTGHWVWNLATPGKLPPIFISGRYYDIYQAAADLLERWAAVWARSYDFSADGQSFHRSQAAAAMLEQAKTYRKQALVHTIPLVRSDSDESGQLFNIGPYDLMGW